MQFLPSIVRLIRPNVPPITPAPIHRLSSSSRPFLSFMTSGTSLWLAFALARGRRRYPLMSDSNPSGRRVSRFPRGSRNIASSSGIEGDESGKLDKRLLIPSANHIMASLSEHSAITQCMKKMRGAQVHGEEDERGTSLNVIYGDEDACRTTLEVSKCDTKAEIVDVMDSDIESDWESGWEYPIPGVKGLYAINILNNSSHRDGSIYRPTSPWKEKFCIADCNESPIDCINYNDGTFNRREPGQMLQFFSLKVAKVPVDFGSVELYGYIAMRDNLDSLLNYVINFSRDNPITVEQGSFINMCGPKRGIHIKYTKDIIMEYDVRIKTGEQEKDDLSLIDGASIMDDRCINCKTFTSRILGECGAIDITWSLLEFAVEATVEFQLSEVQSKFNLCISCFTSGILEEIRLFDGAICESRGLKRSVVAVSMDAQLDLNLKVDADSSIPVDHCCSFKANMMHGCSTQDIKTDFALILVKVTWSTLPYGWTCHNFWM